MDGPSFAADLGLVALLLAGAPAAAEVRVEFVAPEHYTDAGTYGEDRALNLRALAQHLEHFGQQCLGEGESLELRVLDVDLAGREEWWHRSGYDLRVMRDITWPRIDLQYLWRDRDGRTLGEARERVADPSYLWRSAYVRSDTEMLPYEKAMLREWFEKRFCRRKG